MSFDRVIREEEAKFSSIMNAEEEGHPIHNDQPGFWNNARVDEISRIMKAEEDGQVIPPPDPHPVSRPPKARCQPYTAIATPNPSQGRDLTQDQRSSLEARLRVDIEHAQINREREQRKELPDGLSMELLEDLAF